MTDDCPRSLYLDGDDAETKKTSLTTRSPCHHAATKIVSLISILTKIDFDSFYDVCDLTSFHVDGETESRFLILTLILFLICFDVYYYYSCYYDDYRG
jgi:hypothetical protein